jgi:hypothetical protein
MDIQILYPNQSFINDHNENIEPEIFNYISIHGKQLFIRKIKKNYQVLTAGWYPSFAPRERYIFTERFHILYGNEDKIKSLSYFKKCAQELIPYINYGQIELF